MSVRQRLLDLADVLCAETGTGEDCGLSAREHSVDRERRRLLTELSLLIPDVAESRDLDGVRRRALRFVRDVGHHNQRRHDLLYDAVGMEVGGSE